MLVDLTWLILGILFYGCGHALTRSRVVADPEHLVVVNGYRRHVYDWPEVITLCAITVSDAM